LISVSDAVHWLGTMADGTDLLRSSGSRKANREQVKLSISDPKTMRL
jgi:hypothetical protein